MSRADFGSTPKKQLQHLFIKKINPFKLKSSLTHWAVVNCTSFVVAMIMVVYLLLSFTSKRGYSLLRNKNKTWSHVNTGARRVRILYALSLQLPSFTHAVFYTTFGCEDWWVEQFLGYRFQTFYTAIISHSAFLQTLVCFFDESVSLLFFPDDSTAREREREAEARKKKKRKAKKSIFSFSHPYA